MIFSHYQTAIFDAVLNTNSNIAVIKTLDKSLATSNELIRKEISANKNSIDAKTRDPRTSAQAITFQQKEIQVSKYAEGLLEYIIALKDQIKISIVIEKPFLWFFNHKTIFSSNSLWWSYVPLASIDFDVLCDKLFLDLFYPLSFLLFRLQANCGELSRNRNSHLGALIH